MALFCSSSGYFVASSVTSPSGRWALGVRFKWNAAATSILAGFNNSVDTFQELRLLVIQSSPSGRCYGSVEGTGFQQSGFSSNGFVTNHWCSVIMEHISDTNWKWHIHNTNSGSSDTLTVTSDPGLTSYTEATIGINGEHNVYANSDLADYFYLTGLTADLTAADISAFRKGVSPELIWPAYLTEYRPMIRDMTGPKNAFSFTETGTATVAAHPPVIYPSRQGIVIPLRKPLPYAALMAPPRGY